MKHTIVILLVISLFSVCGRSQSLQVGTVNSKAADPAAMLQAASRLQSSALQLLSTGWDRIDIGSKKGLGTVSFINKDTGWIGGEEGLYKSYNGGQSWSNQGSPSSAASNFRFYDGKFGWINGTTILMLTTNGGTDWKQEGTHIMGGVLSADFWNLKYAYATGDGQISSTNDSGKTWNGQGIAAPQLGSVLAFDSLNASALGDTYFWPSDTKFPNTATVFTTSNGGNSWQRVKNRNLQRPFFCAQKMDSTTIYAAGGHVFAISTDRGRTWPTFDSTIDIIAYGLYFRDRLHGTLVGAYGKVFQTNDAGKTWDSVSLGQSLYLAGVYFADSLDGWIVGDGGLVLHTTNGGKASVPVQPATLTTITLRSFPDPFQSTVTVSYVLPEFQSLTARVYDSAGRPVLDLLQNSPQSAGSHSIVVRAGDLPNGAYTVQVSSMKYSGSVKMNLVK
jgi:photosystem II stability/assembly factor-like uncharacterized protein